MGHSARAVVDPDAAPSYLTGDSDERLIGRYAALAIGAFLWHKKVQAGMDPDEAFATLPVLLDVDGGGLETAEEARRAGMAFTLAYHLAYKNDEAFANCTPEERYTKYLAWIDEQLAVAA